MQNELYKKLAESAYTMQQHALCPYSGFSVGASILCADGSIYSGHNIESASYSLTICAERVAIFQALTKTRSPITHLALSTKTGSYPCGACRQIMIEYCTHAAVYILQDLVLKDTTSTQALFPHAFNTQDLCKRDQR